MRLFNGGYSAKDNGFDNGREFVESSNNIEFGKHTAVNGVKVWFGESDFKFLDFYASDYSAIWKCTNEITFYASVNSKSKIGNDEIMLYSDKGKIGYLKDDGTTGDEYANDNIFSGTFQLSNINSEEVRYYAVYHSVISEDISINFHEEISKVSLNQNSEFCSLVNSIVFANNKEIQEKFNELISFLDISVNQGKIASYDIGNSGVMIRFNDGSQYLYYYESFNPKSSDTNKSRAKLTSNKLGNITANNPNSEIIVLSPFYNSMPYKYYETATKILETVPEYSSCGEYINENVTLDVLKTLDNYKVIILSTHGGLCGQDNNDFGFLYGTPYDEETKFDYIQKYMRDYSQGNIYVGVLEDNSTYWGVKTNFFRNNFNANSFDDALVYMGACHGADNNALEKVLRQKGVSTIFAYSGSVPENYDFKMYESIFDNLLTNINGEYVKASNALVFAKAKNGANSHQTGLGLVNVPGLILGLVQESAELHLLGNQDWSFSNHLTHKGQITGYIKEEKTSISLENITIYAISANAKKEVKTNSNGKFTFNLPAGTWEISVEDTDTHWCNEKRTITVERDEEVTLTPPFYMKKGTKVQGSVLDSTTKAPVANATVEVFDNSDVNIMKGTDGTYDYADFKKCELVTTTTTDENGKYTLNLQAEKNYAIAVKCENYKFNGLLFYLEKGLDGYFPADILLVANGGGEWESKPNENKQCITNMPITSFDRYTGNQGDSCVYHLDKSGLIGTSDTKYYRNGNVGINGTEYNHGLEVWLARWNFTNEISWAYAVYELNGNFKKLTGKTGLIRGSTNTSNFDTTVYFYDGETLLQSYNLTNSDYNKEIDIDLSGVDELKILVKDNIAVKGGTSFALYDMFLN